MSLDCVAPDQGTNTHDMYRVHDIGQKIDIRFGGVQGEENKRSPPVCRHTFWVQEEEEDDDYGERKGHGGGRTCFGRELTYASSLFLFEYRSFLSSPLLSSSGPLSDTRLPQKQIEEK